MERRNFLKVGAAALSTATVATVISKVSNASDQSLARSQETLMAEIGNVEEMSPDEVLAVLMEGNKRFVKQKRQNPSQDLIRVEELAEGQAPFACILGCADSRVPPEIVFDKGLGHLFVVRDAGNVATPEEIGSLEFGTLVLGAKVLMVMGHQNCGAVKAALKGGSLPGSIGSIVDAILPAVAQSALQTGDRVENAVKANVLLQKERVKSSPVISKLIKEGKLKVVGAYYNLETGEVTLIS